MDYILVAVFGFIGGTFSGFFLWEPKRILLEKQKRDQDVQLQRIMSASQVNDDNAQVNIANAQTLAKKVEELKARRKAYDEEESRLKERLEARRKAFDEEESRLKVEEDERTKSAWAEVRFEESRLKDELEFIQKAFDQKKARLKAEEDERTKSVWAKFRNEESSLKEELEARRKAYYEEESRLKEEEDKRIELAWATFRSEESRLKEEMEASQKAFHEKESRLKVWEDRRIELAWAEVRNKESSLKAESDRFDARFISAKELQDENVILKCDLRNLAVHVRKLQLDSDQQLQSQKTLDEKIKDVGSRYLKDTVKWISVSLNPNNFAACKQRLQDVIERVRFAAFDLKATEESALFANLKAEYQKAVRAAFEREEQARIKSQIREEQLRQKEIDRELKQLEREREAIKAALEKALADAKDQHSEEVERLKARLAEAEARSQRAISQAQLTKSGHVYVISNVGSFGPDVYKIGMTRRLEPLDRVKELGDASVPFPFDVHAMISCDDAPSLENALHRTLHKTQINKTNPRKEFFKTDIETIFRIVTEHHGQVEYVVDAEALQYRQSISMSDEDQEFIETVYDDLDEDAEVTV